MNVNDILNESKINKKKMKSVKNKDNKSKFMEKDIEKAEKYNTKRILKEKDNYKEDNNNYINNIKAKKHNDIFQFNKHKILLKKEVQISQNIIKIFLKMKKMMKIVAI